MRSPVILHIKNLRLECIIGVNPEERQKKQAVEIDISLSCMVEEAVNSDDIDSTVNYQTLSDDITEKVRTSSFALIEKLGGMVAEACLDHPLVTEVAVTVRKPGALEDADYAAVEIRRSK